MYSNLYFINLNNLITRQKIDYLQLPYTRHLLIGHVLPSNSRVPHCLNEKEIEDGQYENWEKNKENGCEPVVDQPVGLVHSEIGDFQGVNLKHKFY